MVRPVYGQGFFHVARGVIYYTIIYDYLEESEEDREVLRDPARRREEERYIARRMQELMDEERIVINGRETRCIVTAASLERRGPRLQAATIHAYMPYEPVEGRNVYENFYEAEEAPYPYTVYWVAPPGGRIVSVDTPGRVRMMAGGRVAEIRVSRGTRLTGYEAVVFTLG